MPTNPVLTSALPFALPDFATATPADYHSAFELGMAAQLAGLERLRDDDSQPTVDNVLGAWEDAEATLRRALNVFYAVHASDGSPELDAVDEEMSPRLAAHEDSIFLDRGLFVRLGSLQQRIDGGEVEADEEDRYALDELLRTFRRAGVELGDAEQGRVRELNRQLAELSTKFEMLNREARNSGAISVTEAELAGLGDDERAALRAGDTFRVPLVNTTQQPLAVKLADPGVRRRLFEASTTRALDGEFDTRSVVIAIARARAERATLLGYPHHAAIVAEAGCAKSTDAILGMLVPLAQSALAKAREESAQLRARYADLAPGTGFTAADWSYVEAIVRKERFAFDEAELGDYLQVDKVLKAVYAAAGELYGITFEPRAGLLGHAPDTQVFEVHDADGTILGLFLMDFWARPTKQGGAWMSNIVDQSTRDATLPVVTNNCNYTRATTSITWDDVITMFHEFGHALHGLLANSKYASRSGANTQRDFVEFPSQVNEHWAWTPGRVLPTEWVQRLAEASRFGQGYATAETELASLVDLAWHMTPLDELPSSPEDVEAFEHATLERWGLADELVPPRYRSQYFAHIWGGGYAASYYGYAWAKVMDADAVAWFDEQGGPSREAGDHFRRTLLAPGGSVDPMETYRRFRGRDPQLAPLLERLGLSITS